VDHLLAWSEGGETGISNLGQPCRKHHRLKHTTPWRPVAATRNSPPGWISPTGRTYPSEEQDWEPPHWPDNTEPDNTEPGNLEPGNLEPGNLEPDNPGPENPEPDNPASLDPPLPADPFPDWAQYTAA
jgi:hypothetical protein